MIGRNFSRKKREGQQNHQTNEQKDKKYLVNGN